MFVIVLQYVSCRYKRDEASENHLPMFKINGVKEILSKTDIAQCAQDANNCMLDLHKKGCNCASKLKGVPLAKTCFEENANVKQHHEQYQKSGAKWAKLLDSCLHGAEAPAADAVLKAKRSAEPDEAATSVAVPSFVTEFQNCAKEVRAHKETCRNKAEACGAFNHCYGEGPTPSDAHLALWHSTVGGVRNATSQAAQSYIASFVACLSGQPAASRV